MIIIDTNVVSALMKAQPDQLVVDWLDAQPAASIWISSITVMEVHFGLLSLPKSRRRANLSAAFRKMLDDVLEGRISPFDTAAAERAAELLALRKTKGQPVEVRDTMIAGIALSTGATLATRNVSHFHDLSTTVVNPWA